MRNVFCRSLVDQADRPEFVFLTGDLGYKALEPLRDALGKRFINAGVAEQNMVSVAAGLARNGHRPWAYSIAPFAYARPFEQIRNDVCLHSLPVVIVGNGGGYGYGSMGATHHALEDYGALLGLPGIRAYIPAFDEDVAELLPHLFTINHPAYLRLGLSERPADFAPPPYAPWRRLLRGGGATLVVVGPLVGGILYGLWEVDYS
jgi:transketolase